MADPTPDVSLCIFCCRRDDVGDGDGCRQCRESRARDLYLERDAKQVDARRKAWAKRTRSPSTGPEALAERQRHHRLVKTTTPRERPDATVDPLELASNAIHRLDIVKRSLGARWSMQIQAADEISEIAEAIRQLAWGPAE